MRHFVPTELVQKPLRRYLETEKMQTTMFAEHANIPIDTLEHILFGKSPSVMFDTADKIITRINVFLWFSEPLSDYYWPEGTEPPDKARHLQCDECGRCFSISATMRGQSNRKYCSKDCVNKFWQKKNRKKKPKKTRGYSRAMYQK